MRDADSYCLQCEKFLEEDQLNEECLCSEYQIQTIQVDSAGTLGSSCRTINLEIKTALEIEQEGQNVS